MSGFVQVYATGSIDIARLADLIVGIAFVEWAAAVYGEYDILASVVAEDSSTFYQAVSEIRNMDGVSSTSTNVRIN